MEVGEVVRRVGLAYWALILGLILVGVAAAGALHLNEAPVYTSDVRFVLDVPDPRAASESTAIADTAKSIATSSSNVASALAAAGVNRDVDEFTKRNIDLQPLGTSGVMDLQVKDTNRAAAAAIANALAADVVSARAAVNQSEADKLTAALTNQIKGLDASIAKIDVRIASFRGLGGDPSVSAAALSGLYSVRASLAQERLTLETEINQVNQSLAMRPQAAIIQPATPAAKADPSRAPIDMALGGIGGLVLGVILASLLATLRPRIKGLSEITRTLAAPVLGTFKSFDDEIDPTLPARIRVVAAKLGVKHVQLVALDGSAEAMGLVNLLVDSFAVRQGSPTTSFPVPLHSNGQVVARPRRATPSQQIDVKSFDPSVFAKSGGGADTGLILVTPEVLEGQHIDATRELRAWTGWPVAGVVTYARGSGRAWRADRMSVRHPALRAHPIEQQDTRVSPFG